MESQATPTNGLTARRRLPAAAENVWMVVEDRLLWPAGDGLKAVAGAARRAVGRAVGATRGFGERAAWPIQRRVVWPVEDRALDFSPPRRLIAAGTVVVLAATAAAAGLLWAGSGGSGGPTTQTAATSKAVAKAAPQPAPSAPEPTLHGAAPVFKPAKPHGTSKVDPAKEVETSSPSSPEAETEAPAPAASAATASIASTPTARASTVVGAPAGPKAIAVARKFSGAFVIYETGGEASAVRETFEATATPRLTKALLHRPPRLPDGVKVPKAKVLNVVAGPSNGRVYTISVSLLRVGVTSELRLEMEQLKTDGWQVTNVLG